LVGSFNLLTDDNTFVTEDIFSQQENTTPIVSIAASDLVGTVTVVLRGDFDFDEDVDGHDFLLWQRGASPSPLSSQDLADFYRNYSTVIPDALTSSATVPEPSSFMITVIAAMIGIIHLRRGSEA